MWEIELIAYQKYLTEEERSRATIDKYVHDAGAFLAWLEEREITKETVIKYKEELTERFAVSSVNSMLAAVNGFLCFMGHGLCRVKTLKRQRRTFRSKERELSRVEYQKLLTTAAEKRYWRINLIMQTICSTGIRVSELRFVTVAAVRRGVAEVRCKGKSRSVLLPQKLCAILIRYIRKMHIQEGAVFVTRNGRPVDRSNVWAEMKRLCISANVPASKVFPHNLRHLFARTYYSVEKDLCHLADLLGHSSVDTTRIYTMTSGREQIAQLDTL